MSFEQLATYLNSLNETTQNISVKKSTIGSSRDTVEFRGTIKNEIENGKNIINNTKKLLTTGFERADRPKVKNLTTQFNELTKQFEKECTEIINQQLRNAIGSGGRSGSLSINGRTAQSNRSDSISSKIQPSYTTQFNQNEQQQQQHLQLQQLEITLSNAEPVEEMILQEYNNEVKTLVKELTILKEISDDLNKLTAEQRPGIEQTNQQTTVARLNVEEANVQLVKANKYACSYRKKMVIIIILVIIVVALVVGLCVGLLKKDKKETITNVDNNSSNNNNNSTTTA